MATNTDPWGDTERPAPAARKPRRARWKRPDRWVAGGTVLVLLLACAVALNLSKVVEQHENARWVNHTHEVMDALGATIGELRAVQSRQHAYLITGEPLDLEGFEPGISRALLEIAHVRALTTDNPLQNERIREVEGGVQALATHWREGARLRQAQGWNAGAEVARIRRGMAMVLRIGERIGAMEEAERELLRQRALLAERAYLTAMLTGLATGTASIVLVVAFAWLLRRNLTRELADAASLRQLSADLREADRRKDRFLATLAHELRNPLAPVRNAAAILGAPGLDDRKLAWVRDVIQRQVGHMAALLDDLLDVARITQGKLTLRRQSVPLAAVVDVAVEAARPLMVRKRHELELRLPRQPLVLDVDPVRLGQAITNLLTNAAKYTDPGGHILLVAEPRGDSLRLAVRDNGIGIEPRALPHLFDMFTQVETARGRSEGGLGIGLALTRGVVQLHGGTLRARSEGPGQGSEFLIDLPATLVVEAPAADESTQPMPLEPSAGYGVLVADDNRDAGESLAMLLELAGHQVRVVDGGRAAIAQVQALRPDIVFLDIGMPDLDGYETARALRALPGGGDIALVAVTGWGQAEDKRRSAAAGFDAHLTKPVDPLVLGALMSRPLQELRHARQAISDLTASS